jgi:hypothetical protein
MPSILNATTSSGLVTSADNSGSLQLATNNGTTAVTIDTSQNVGIGTASPSGKFHVVGASSQSPLILDTTLFNQIVLRVNGTNRGQIYADSTNCFSVVDSTGGAARLNVTDAGLLQFNSGYGSAATAYGCRAWANFNGTGTVAIRGSANVSSITDNGTGDYTVNFTTAMPDVNYSATIGTPTTAGGGALFLAALANVGGWTTSRIFIRAINSNLTYWDPEIVCVAIHR